MLSQEVLKKSVDIDSSLIGQGKIGPNSFFSWNYIYEDGSFSKSFENRAAHINSAFGGKCGLALKNVPLILLVATSTYRLCEKVR